MFRWIHRVLYSAENKVASSRPALCQCGADQKCAPELTGRHTALTGHLLYEGSFEADPSQNSKLMLKGEISHDASVFK